MKLSKLVKISRRLQSQITSQVLSFLETDKLDEEEKKPSSAVQVKPFPLIIIKPKLRLASN